MKLYEIVFSATGRTKKVTDIVCSVFNEHKIKIDLSNPNFKKKYMIFNKIVYVLYLFRYIMEEFQLQLSKI